nr:hypothetical protein [Eubacterium sp.]
MKTRKILSVMLSAALLLQLLFAGSVTAFAGEAINVTNEAELTAALNKTEVVDSINITDDFTIGSDCTIQYDSTHINYYSDTVVTVADGVTLTVGVGGMFGSFWPSFEGDWNTPPLPNGKIINNGKIIVADGGALEADIDTNNGDIEIKNGGFAVMCKVNNGTVTVEDGGTYATTQGEKAENKGIMTVYEGAVIESRMGCTLINETNGVINLYGNFNCGCINFGSGDDFWFENKGT